MFIHMLFGFILSHYINIPMCVDVYPYFLYLISYMQKFIYICPDIIYICPETLYVCHKKVTTCILHDTPCHLVIIWYLVYFTVGFGHPPQDVDILWIISKSNVFCLLLARRRLCLQCWAFWVWTQNVVNTSASNTDFMLYRLHNN